MIVICPRPYRWHDVHKRLTAVSDLKNLPSPPIPLILAGWEYSSDQEKLARWEETVKWANKHGLSSILDEIQDEDMYCVDSISTYVVGPLGGPSYLDWNFDPRDRPPIEEVEKMMQKIKQGWHSIAGEISDFTTPLYLSGKKFRKLNVAYLKGSKPPWGTWVVLNRDETRRHFTALRASVNKIVSPHEIDHIDFVGTDNIK